MEDAELTLKRALAIFHKIKYPDEYIILENLADVYQKKSKMTSSQYMKEQEIFYLEKAISIVTYSFPENSPHFIRIKKKHAALFI